MPDHLAQRARVMAAIAGTLLVAAVLSFALLTYIAVHHTQALDRSWHDLRQRAEHRQVLISGLEGELGYGKFIHAFKNYVLRGESASLSQFDESLGRLRTTIAAARAGDMTPAEAAAISRVEDVVETYARNLRLAVSMRADGAPITVVDQAVRIEEAPAIAALDELRATAAAAHAALNREMVRLQQDRTDAWAAYGGFCLVVLALAVMLLRMLRSNVRRVQGLARMQAGFLALLEVSRDGLISLSPDMRITSFNAAAERMFGYVPAEVVGQPLDVLLSERDRERHRHDVLAFAAGPEMVREMGDWRRIRGLTRDGREIPMMGAISKRHHGGEAILSVTLRDMSEAVRLDEKLHESNRAAVDAVRAKSRFFATISHELRTPLNGIIGFAQAIEQEVFGPIGNDKYKEYAGLIQHSGEKLHQLVNNVIDFAALETGRHQPEIEAVDPLAAAQTAIADVAATAEHNRVDCRLAAAETAAPVAADARGLRQVLLNLLGNSLKYTSPGGAIELYVEQNDTHTLFRVSDTGVGIPAQSLGHVTEPFGQAETGDPLTAGRTTDGPGLGLAIVREVVEAHGGMLHIESEVNVGTVVSVTWPNVVARFAAEVAPAQPVEVRQTG